MNTGTTFALKIPQVFAIQEGENKNYPALKWVMKGTKKTELSQ